MWEEYLRTNGFQAAPDDCFVQVRMYVHVKVVACLGRCATAVMK